MSVAAASPRRRFARVRGVVIEFPVAPRPKVAQGEPAPPLLPPGGPTFYIASEDLPPPPSRPWYRRPPPIWQTDSRTFCMDDPGRLRFAPMADTGSAFLALCEDGAASPRRASREAAALLRDWIENDQGRRYDLATALGLKRAGNSLRDIDARAEIAVYLVAVARTAQFAALPPPQAAEALRRAFERWCAAVWPLYSERPTAPAIGQPGESFWRICAHRLARPLPNEARIAALIAADRQSEISTSDC